METITRKPYETDLTDDEWAILEPVLKRALYGDKTKTRGHPRHYPLREITGYARNRRFRFEPYLRLFEEPLGN